MFLPSIAGRPHRERVEIGYFCIIGNVHPNLVTICDHAVVTARVTILEHDNAYYYTVGELSGSAPSALEIMRSSGSDR